MVLQWCGHYVTDHVTILRGVDLGLGCGGKLFPSGLKSPAGDARLRLPLEEVASTNATDSTSFTYLDIWAGVSKEPVQHFRVLKCLDGMHLKDHR